MIAPRTHLLSNGSYSVMVTAAGSGYSRWRNIALTRWREDPTCDPWGYYVFLRDLSSGQVWSAGYQPVGREPDSYGAAFFEDQAQINRQDGSLLTAMQIVVSSEDNAEVRRISLTNQGREPREIELTSYAEVVLNEPAADSAHPAFSKMFVQTEFAGERGALLATRRSREPGEAKLWMVHFSCVQGQAVGAWQFETDRARFLGRGRDVRNAASIIDGRLLSNTAGTVLDAVLALRRRVRIEPGETVRAAFWMGIAATRALALTLADKYGDEPAFERAQKLSLAKAEMQLRELGMDATDAQLCQDIASRLLYADSSLRASPQILGANRLGQSTLWAHGISGDLPIVLATIDDEAGLDVIVQLLRALRYWQCKCLAVDLVILNDGPASGAAALQTALDAAIKASPRCARDASGGGRGSVSVLRADALPREHRDLLQTAARVIFAAHRGPLRNQLAISQQPAPRPRPRARLGSSRRPALSPAAGAAVHAVAPSLEFVNGLGGFDAAAREYVVVIDHCEWTPTPWVNVIANPQFGFLVSADGSGSTWSLNAQQNQITPWCNDPVSNAPADAIYIRDEKSGDLWSAMPLPIRVPSSVYTVRHGFGYTRSQHASHGISVHLLQFVPLEDPVKISRLTIVNDCGETRRLSITYYLDWMLGNQNNRAAPFIITEVEPRTLALLARNPWSRDFQPRVAFMDMAGRQQGYTADRTEFIGRYGSLAEPAALLGMKPLGLRVGGGLDPCGAMQTEITLSPGESVELKLLLGEESSTAAAVALIERYRNLDLDAVFKGVTDFWQRTLGVVQVRTPDRSMDIILNGWLLYQTLSCRVWGRTAFYQSSGAYGYRDQLQDVMALCVCAPAIAREHILRAAGRQFAAGDVQHWWLPTTGAGIKTRVSDDRIWLAFVTAHYLEVTADFDVLGEQVPFLAGGPLAVDALENFSAPGPADSVPLFDHCARALDSSMGVGAHGLPLMGTGDWNDGMNRVGAAGRGESAWVGWFLHAALLRFAPIAEQRGESAKAAEWRKHALALSQAIEREAWDGSWYLHGYYDDGTPLGSVLSDECRIDSIAQSWAVISGAGESDRAMRAMAEVDAQLVSRRDGLVKLFTPPFDHTTHDPGYIKAYPPGLRENGGQYTHAAVWTTLAFALLGDGDKAGELFSLLNPINHASTRAAVQNYKVEPYVICADVYSVPPHVGRGGWTWYTGSAGWMYRTGTEGILGIYVRGQILKVDPCIPRAWSGFEFTYRYRSSRYRIAVKNPRGVSRGIAHASLDGRELAGTLCEIELADDGRDHYGEVTLG
ncbi:MAG: GH36-type glycosyl hydrolase domain-containing protein [Steroidobacteraceae bacterium]